MAGTGGFIDARESEQATMDISAPRLASYALRFVEPLIEERSSRRANLEENGQRILLTVEMLFTIADQRLASGPDGPELRLDLRTTPRLEISRAGRRAVEECEAEMTLSFPIIVSDPDDSGTTAVRLESRAARVSGLTIHQLEAGAPYRSEIEELLESQLIRLITDRDESIVLFRVDALRAGEFTIPFWIQALEGSGDPDRLDRLNLVLSSTLLPHGSWRAPRGGDVDALARVSVHPGLPLALLMRSRLGAATVRVDDEGRIDSDGRWNVSIESLEWVEDDLALRLRFWELGSGRCRTDMMTLQWSPEIEAGRVSLGRAQVDVDDGLLEQADWPTWAESNSVTFIERGLESALNAPNLRSQAGGDALPFGEARHSTEGLHRTIQIGSGANR